MKKYLFGLLVVVYVTSTIGVPVYMHYCGGELEQVSFLIESDSCCGGDEDDMEPGCCDTENAFARNTPDFTFQKTVDSDFQISAINLFTINPFINFEFKPSFGLVSKCILPPPDLLQSNIIRTTFLRI